MKTLSHAIGPTDPALIEQPIERHFEAMVQRFPQREALVSRHQNLRYTYHALNRDCDQLASALMRAGLAQGDRVGIWAHNCAEWVLMHPVHERHHRIPQGCHTDPWRAHRLPERRL